MIQKFDNFVNEKLHGSNTPRPSIDLRGERQLGKYTQKAYNKIREYVPFISNDEIMYNYIHTVDDLIRSEELFDFVFETVTEINLTSSGIVSLNLHFTLPIFSSLIKFKS